MIYFYNTLNCTPSRARYTVNNSYVNSVQNMSVLGVFKEHLVDLWQENHTTDAWTVVPGFSDVAGEPAKWDNDTKAWYRMTT